MRKTAALLLLAAVTAVPGYTQSRTLTLPLFTDYDLDVPTEVADTDQVVTSVNLTNTSFTIAANPDVCRELTMTVTDTTDSINAGTITAVGTGCDGEAITWAVDVSSHAGGAVVYNSIDATENGDPNYFFATVTSVTAVAVATLGGGGDETIIVGTGSTVPEIACVTRGGRPNDLSPGGDWMRGNAKVETSGLSATLTGVDAAADAFLDVDAGDELWIINTDSNINAQDHNIYRVVLTNADDDTVTLGGDPVGDVELDDRAEGYTYFWRDRHCGQGQDDGWFQTMGAAVVTASVNMEAHGSGGNIDFALECRNKGAESIPVPAVQQLDQSAAVVFSMTVTGGYDECRVTMLLDGADDASDAVVEDLDATVHLRY